MLRRDVRKQTGLNLYKRVDDNGVPYLDYSHGRDRNGNKRATASARRNAASTDARQLVIQAIDSPRSLVVENNKEGKLQVGNSLLLDAKQVESLMYNLEMNSNLNPNTIGMGMIFYHELNHWLSGATANDPTTNTNPVPGTGTTYPALTAAGTASTLTGPTVDAMNAIRTQLTASGLGNYGQRTSYFIIVGNLKVVTFSAASRAQIMANGSLDGVTDYTFKVFGSPEEQAEEDDGQNDYER